MSQWKLPCFGEEFRVRKEGWYAVLRNFEDDLVSVFPDIHFSSEERSVRDRAAAAHHAIVCVLSCKAAPAVDQRDRIAGAHLHGVVDGCLMDAPLTSAVLVTVRIVSPAVVSSGT